MVLEAFIDRTQSFASHESMLEITVRVMANLLSRDQIAGGNRQSRTTQIAIWDLGFKSRKLAN
jgi:hypothetical protein